VDPITGLGIGHALRDAELLSTAIVHGLGGRNDLGAALARYEKQRNRETKPAFDLIRLMGMKDFLRLAALVRGEPARLSAG
jgi:2-polyprenyl-6-methoxyphenol hydroxylase-like FAD-dependent oxidoreductase